MGKILRRFPEIDRLRYLEDKDERIKENVKVQVLERSFEFKTLKIKFPDGRDPYWVKDGSLKQINCAEGGNH